MGFLARLFGRGRSADVGLSSDLLIPADRPPVGTAEGNPSAVDDLGRVTGGPLGGSLVGPDRDFGADLFIAGADAAVAADLGVDMSSHGDELDDRQATFWEALRTPPEDAGREDDDPAAPEPFTPGAL